MQFEHEQYVEPERPERQQPLRILEDEDLSGPDLQAATSLVGAVVAVGILGWMVFVIVAVCCLWGL